MILNLLKNSFNLLYKLLLAPFRLISFSISKLCNLLRFNISFKLTLFFAILIPSLLMIENLYLIDYAYSNHFRSIYDKLSKDADYIHSIVISKYYSKELVDSFSKINSLDIYIYNNNNEQVYSYTRNTDSNATVGHTLDIKEYFNFEEKFSMGFILPSNVSLNSKYDNVNIILISPFSDQKNAFQSLVFVSICFNFFLILFVILIVNKMSRKLLKPIKNMTSTVQNISILNIDERLDIKGTKDELKDLAITFNGMMDRIESSYVKQRQFVNDASHELRTPIAVLKGYANMLNRWGKEDPKILEESIDSIVSETNQMQSLVEKLLYLARNDKNSLKLDKELFSISDLIDESLQDMKLIDSDHKYVSKSENEINFFGDRIALKEALRIFLDNSMKYTLEGGTIFVSTKTSHKSIFISIADNGIGISKIDLPHVFERFYRADKSRAKSMGGSGLGLSIAKIIIDQHHGSIWIDSIENEGTIVTIILPNSNDQ